MITVPEALAQLDEVARRNELRFAVITPFVELADKLRSKWLCEALVVRVGTKVLAMLQRPELEPHYRTDLWKLIHMGPSGSVACLMNRWYVVPYPELAEDEMEMVGVSGSTAWPVQITERATHPLTTP